MVRLLGLRGLSFGLESPPREITPSGSGDSSGSNGWLIRFFDSAFFSEWIAVSYLYKHDHSGVRDYLCNRMYTLPLLGIEAYLFQVCYMLVHRPSPSLDKFVIDTCAKSLRIALKVHWLLAAELELEDLEDAEGIAHVQERCQIAATLTGEWPPLVRPLPTPPSPRTNPMLDKIRSSKQRLLSLASSPALGSSPPVEEVGEKLGLPSSEENKLLKRLSLGPKVPQIFWRSMEKDDENQDKEGFFKRLLRDSKDKEMDEGDKEGFLRRFLRESRDRDKEIDKEGDDGLRDGLFRRLLKDGKDEERELTSSSEGFLKRLFPDKEEKPRDDDEKEGFFRRVFKDKDKEEKPVDDDEREGFFRRVFKDKDKEEKPGEDDEKEGFFRKVFKDKNEGKKENGSEKRGEEKSKAGGDEDDEKDNFFCRFFKDKIDEKVGAPNEKERITNTAEEDKKEGFFRHIFKDRNEDKKESSRDQKEDGEKLHKSSEDDNLFRRIFKDNRTEEKKGAVQSKIEDEKCNQSIDEIEKENFFRRLFKDKHDGKRTDGLEKNEDENKGNGTLDEEESTEFLSFRRLFRVHPEEPKSGQTNANNQSQINESSPGTENFFKRLFRDRDRSVEDFELFGSRSLKENHPGSPTHSEKHNGKPPLPNNTISELRKAAYHASLEFVQSLCDTSYGLVDIFPIEDRKIALRESIMELNSRVADAEKNGGVCFPMGKGIYRVINIPEDEATLLNSREKAPYLICVEVLKSEVQSNVKVSSDSLKLSKGGIPLGNRDVQLPTPPPWAYPLWIRHDSQLHDSDRMSKSTSQAIDHAMAQLWEPKVKLVSVNFSIEKLGRVKRMEPRESVHRKRNAATSFDLSNDSGANDDSTSQWVKVTLSAIPGVSMEDVDDQDPTRRKDHRRVPSKIALEEVKEAAAKGETPVGLPLKGAGQGTEHVDQQASVSGNRKPTDALAGELWALKKERIQKLSVHGKLPGWDLRSVIVKSGDDCRQEHMAVQLVAHFYDIYQEAGLPLWVRPYEVIVTSAYTGLIETIPDTASIHAIKSRFPEISSLRYYFMAKYDENSPNFKIAQRNFVESMAGYSILCYLLQVKDRHNGNLLIDEEGHIIHIDFGFMLSNSPGGVNFESAPFKLTRELLEVMDSDAEGTPSEFFDYFKVLCIQGFLTCRKHAERIILLVEMLQDSGFPCFKGGPRTIQNLRKRFHLSLTEEQCVTLVLSLIGSSLDAWRTRQYDYYQRVLNGIL